MRACAWPCRRASSPGSTRRGRLSSLCDGRLDHIMFIGEPDSLYVSVWVSIEVATNYGTVATCSLATMAGCAGFSTTSAAPPGMCQRLVQTPGLSKGKCSRVQKRPAKQSGGSRQVRGAREDLRSSARLSLSMLAFLSSFPDAPKCIIRTRRRGVHNDLPDVVEIGHAEVCHRPK